MRTNSMGIVRTAIWNDMDTDDLNSFHDTVLEATGKSLDTAKLKQIFDALPDHLIHEIFEWTISDTVVRDDIYLCLKESLSASTDKKNVDGFDP